MNWYIRFLLLSVFIGAILLIVVLQFNASRSINNLVNSNQRMLQDFDVKADLNELKGNIVVLENKVQGLVISGHLGDTEYLRNELDEVSKVLLQLDKERFDAALHPKLDSLQLLVTDKVKFNQQVLDTFRFKGQVAAIHIINTHRGTRISDSIRLVINNIEEAHKVRLTALIDKADASGQRAKKLGIWMAVIAVLASATTFSYALVKVLQQQKLIELLNISEKKALKAGQAKENFLSNMSHEIRTPLNAIIGFANLLGQRKLDRDAEGYVNTIRSAGENLLSIINDVLDSSKIEAGMMRIEKLPFNLSGLVHSVEMMFRHRVGNNLRFAVEVEHNIPVLMGDPVRLTQILVNILNNAFKFTAEGEVSLAVRSAGVDGDVMYVSFITSDTGIGIDDDKMKKIFDRFQQAEDSVTRKYGGTGLGLSIVKELVELQNGTVLVESTPGVGTRFVVTIPYELKMNALKAEPNLTLPQSDTLKLENVKVLLVEDNVINQSLLRQVFTKWGVAFSVAGNGIEALDMLKGSNYDCILMDIQMPELDGYNTTHRIRKELQLKTPVIAMTAHVMAGEREKCLSHGMDDYISKPIDERELFRLVAKYAAINQQAMDEDKNRNIPYRHIRLQYMEDIAQGNIGYKKMAVSMFIEAVPEELVEMEKALNAGDLERLKGLVHNFKTTISILGVLSPLEHPLRMLETNSTGLDAHLEEIKTYCSFAIEEAHLYLTTLD